MTVALATTYHDPNGRLYDQIYEHLPALVDIFSGIAINASAIAYEKSLRQFIEAGALIDRRSQQKAGEAPNLGNARRGAVTLALEHNTPFIMYCDCDRILHWVAYYPDELIKVVAQIQTHDFTVLGRTERAFKSHPHVQLDTEGIVNQLFHRVTGYNWDIMAGARGLSRRAVNTIEQGCADPRISVDVSWPLHLLSLSDFTINSILTEGLEFETAAQHKTEIEEAGGYVNWVQARDADLDRWLFRLELTKVHIQAMKHYVNK